ncbi:DUF6399 domain-containing protein [Bathymodiolus japonicus methanotrophic gill symbiont]|uniref:DUF6399 domain-containing protein n=1 Tax=Bathymodiolus japonicus methanotrophic gill symbiont TaxID=113269 RepID=UPI001C8E245F
MLISRNIFLRQNWASRLSRDTQYYGLKRQGGTTASKRFFEQDFSGLFSWILGQMGELPLPRNGRPKVVLDPLKLQVSRLRREAQFCPFRIMCAVSIPSIVA